MARDTQILFRQLLSEDIERALELWHATPGVGISGGDDPRGLAVFLSANEGLCWCAERDGELCGTILCGSDGRRGYVYHLAVSEESRGAGAGRALVRRAVDALRDRGISRCHAMVFASNAGGRAFWERVGWRERDELVLFSLDT